MNAIAKAKAWLWRLVHDQRGNTLAIAAVSLIPLIALSGGAVDASRAYMAKTQLQAACDAGVLAGRRALGKSGNYGSAEIAKADQMFRANFDATDFGVDQPTFSTSVDSKNDVYGQSSVPLPTVVMSIFNYDEIDLAVSCMAELQVANTDVMFVLDTTGSMGSTGIEGLRNAVKDFHATLADAEIDGQTRIRYGFVPYSLTVNAKGLIAAGQLSTDAFATSVNYPTVLAKFDNEDTILTNETTTGSYTEDYSGNYLTKSSCQSWGGNYGNSPVVTGNKAVYYAYSKWTQKVKYGNTWYGTCERKVTSTQREYKTVYKFSGWVFQVASVDATGLTGMSAVTYVNPYSIGTSDWVETEGTYDLRELAEMSTAGTASGLTTTTSTWDGCILERQTVEDYTFDPVPSDAYDHDIDMLPSTTDPTTQWKPRWNAIAWRKDGNQPSGTGIACPAQMKELTEVDMSSTTVPTWLSTYLNTLSSAGYTYHDIGMIWGARLGSATGPFSSLVNDKPNVAVNRHLIFMTDGAMQPDREANSAYGVEEDENRVAPSGTSDTNLKSYHNNRFAAACTAAKEKGYTIWVIAFGTTITDQLRACSSGGRAYFSSNTDELRQRFAYIASQVADLRLGQ